MRRGRVEYLSRLNLSVFIFNLMNTKTSGITVEECVYSGNLKFRFDIAGHVRQEVGIYCIPEKCQKSFFCIISEIWIGWQRSQNVCNWCRQI